MSLFRMGERLSGRWPVRQGYCGVRGFDEPQPAAERGLMSPENDLRSSDGGAAFVNAIHEPTVEVIQQKGAILLRKYCAKTGA